MTATHLLTTGCRKKIGCNPLCVFIIHSCVSRLITVPPPSKQLCFRISSGIANQDTPDEKALLGNFYFFYFFNVKCGQKKGFFTLVGHNSKSSIFFPVDSKQTGLELAIKYMHGIRIPIGCNCKRKQNIIKQFVLKIVGSPMTNLAFCSGV